MTSILYLKLKALFEAPLIKIKCSSFKQYAWVRMACANEYRLSHTVSNLHAQFELSFWEQALLCLTSVFHYILNLKWKELNTKQRKSEEREEKDAEVINNWGGRAAKKREVGRERRSAGFVKPENTEQRNGRQVNKTNNTRLKGSKREDVSQREKNTL